MLTAVMLMAKTPTTYFLSCKLSPNSRSSKNIKCTIAHIVVMKMITKLRKATATTSRTKKSQVLLLPRSMLISNVLHMGEE